VRARAANALPELIYPYQTTGQIRVTMV
jgi:hypothetical protein